jgi:hypothetical protein
VHVIPNSNDVTFKITGGKYMSEFFENTLNYGVYGVELFFFLSGWLLVSIYGINKNQKFELKTKIKFTDKDFNIGMGSKTTITIKQNETILFKGEIDSQGCM